MRRLNSIEVRFAADSGELPSDQTTRLPHQRIRSQRGYILLVLLLTVAMLSIGSLAIVQEFKFQYQRDQEEEMIHRGVQYARAVKKYFKKFGRYPTRIEDLENTNNYRCLRRRYKDPINRDKATGKELDFKLLHMTDIQMSFNPGAASMLPPGPDANISAENPTGAANGTTGDAASVTAEPGTQNSPGNTSPQQGVQATPGTPNNPITNPSQQVFGGGAIVGVVSLSKAATVREFNKKNHYNQWQFIYDPSSDRGGLLMTPNQPPIQGAVPVNQLNGPPAGTPQNGPGTNPTQQPQQPPQNQDIGVQQ